MCSTMTLDQLAEAVLGTEINKAINAVNLECISSDAECQSLTVDDMADKQLDAPISQAIRRVDLSMEMLDFGIDTKLFKVCVRVRGLSLLILVIILASLFMSEQSLLDIIHTLVSSQ